MINESEFTQEELEAFAKEQKTKEEEILAAEAMLKNKIVEDWTSWKQHPYSVRLIELLEKAHSNILNDIQDSAGVSDIALKCIVTESRVLRGFLNGWLKAPLINTPAFNNTLESVKASNQQFQEKARKLGIKLN